MSYIPPHFEESDPTALQALVQAHPLAVWVLPHQGDNIGAIHIASQLVIADNKIPH